MMRESQAPVFFCSLLAFSSLGAVPAGAEPAERLPAVDRAIEFHGGDTYQGSRTRLKLCSASGCSQLDVEMDAGLFEYTAIAPTRRGERKVTISNDSVRHWLDGEPQEVESDATAAGLRDWVMARVYFCFLPYRLNDPGVYKEDLGQVAWGDRELHKVKVTFEVGSSSDAQDEYMYWLDPETSRVELFAYSYERGDPGLRFRRNFNYRRVGGILFFDQENLGVEGEGLSVDLLTPEYVETALRHVSTVELKDIQVETLD